MDDLTGLSDSALLDRLQRGAFSYIADHTDAETGLVADTSRADSPCSIAVVGFALSCYPIAVKNGWMSRATAAQQTLKTLRSFWDSPQSDQSDATTPVYKVSPTLIPRTRGRAAGAGRPSRPPATRLRYGRACPGPAPMPTRAATTPTPARWPTRSTAGSIANRKTTPMNSTPQI